MLAQSANTHHKKSPREHDPASCHLCEVVPPDAFRRHWKREAKSGYWHVVADGPDLMARLPRQAHFATVLSYQLGGDGARHYQGSWYWEHDADDPAHALEDLRRCLQILDIEYGCPLEAVHIWHSGGRGLLVHQVYQALVREGLTRV